MPEPATDPLAALDPTARRAGPRARIAVGAAVVVFIAAVAIAAIVSFASSGGGAQGVVAAHGENAADAPGGSAAPAGGAGATGGGGTGSAAAGAAVVLVHVLGAVVQPGLVELRPGARVVDAIAAAGGLTGDADQAGVNLARPVTDGEQLVVPRVGEVPPPPAAGAGGTDGGLVNLNTADAAELDTLPRIGPALAARIIDWREANGGFTSVDQLLEVAGIGDAVFAGLAELVTL